MLIYICFVFFVFYVTQFSLVSFFSVHSHTSNPPTMESAINVLVTQFNAYASNHGSPKTLDKAEFQSLVMSQLPNFVKVRRSSPTQYAPRLLCAAVQLSRDSVEGMFVPKVWDVRFTFDVGGDIVSALIRVVSHGFNMYQIFGKKNS